MATNRIMAGVLAGGLALAPLFPAARAAPTDPDARAIARGQLIYDYDQAGWHATDEMFKRLPDPAAAGVRGWIVEPVPDGLKVTFFGLDGTVPYAIFESLWQGGRIASNRTIAEGHPPLSALAQTMVRPRQIAIARPFERCNSGAPNPVVLPPEHPGDPVPVYILTPMIHTGTYPAGRHREIDVDARGKIVFEREFTKTCIALSSGPLPPGSTAVSAFVTHLLDPRPTALHVYLSLWMHQPLYVAAASGIFEVNGTTIRTVDKSALVPVAR